MEMPTLDNRRVIYSSFEHDEAQERKINEQRCSSTKPILVCSIFMFMILYYWNTAYMFHQSINNEGIDSETVLVGFIYGTIACSLLIILTILCLMEQPSGH